MTLVEHLKSRNLDMEKHKVWLNEEERVATFPLYNLLGVMTGYQQYRPEGTKKINNNPKEGKYFTKSQQAFAMWGLESWSFSNTLFVAEGLFDAAKLTYLGYSAVAVFCNNLSADSLSWVRFVQKIRPVVFVRDADVAGKWFSSYGTTICTEHYKDLGEAPLSYVKELVKNYD